MKKLAALFAGAALMLGMAVTAHAIPYFTPSIADLASFTELKQDPSGATAEVSGIDNYGTYVDMQIKLAPNPNTLSNAQFVSLTAGKNLGSGSDFSPYATYQLSIFNHNESPWQYSLYVKDLDGTEYNTTWQSIVQGTGEIVVMDMSTALASGIDLANVVAYGLNVGAVVPQITSTGRLDVMSETYVAPVPEPGTILLLGGGLLGLAFYGKRRMKI